MRLATSGDTPSGLPSARVPVTSKKFAKLIAARKTPVGANISTIDWLTLIFVSQMLKIGCRDMAADDMAIGELTDWRRFVITYIT